MPSSIKTRSFPRPIAAILAALALAVPAAAAVLEDTVAKVNGSPIMLSEYNREIRAVLEAWRQNAPGLLADPKAVAELKKKVLDDMVDHELLFQEADRQKLKVHDRELENTIAQLKESKFRRDESGKALSDPEVDAALAAELKREGLSQEQFRERLRRQVLMQKVVQEGVRPRVKTPTEADAKGAWEKFQQIIKGSTASVSGMGELEAQAYLAFGQQIKDFSSERVRAAHILVKASPKSGDGEAKQALDRIKDLKKRAQAGEDFADLARKYSDDTESAVRGGDLGFIVRGYLPPELDKAIFATAVGEISEPARTDFGYHVVRVAEKRAAETLTFEKVKDDVMQFIMRVRSNMELEKFVKELRAKGRIETHLPKEEAKESKESAAPAPAPSASPAPPPVKNN
ncbi:MAG: peptidylprolyl isomerase [Elusimicrobia bacterium]|nr:peptidylprolyl isomerase [Elusimicrobiota bacterium]